jgi:GDPmannose 4,6-dehydratase
MRKAIVFGAAGQDGYYLTELLNGLGINVIAVSRSNGFEQVDLSNYAEVSSLIHKHKPNFLFHLAANSSTSHTALLDNHEVITTGTVNVLEAVKNYSPHTKVFISGSALQFKNNNTPIDESTPFEAKDAYSACRISSTYMARYFRSIGLYVYVGYFFNHDSERRSSRHISKKIADAALSASKGNINTIEIGDINAVKEHSHAKDIVKAVWILVNQTHVFEAVIGSGIGNSIKEWLNECFGLFGLDWSNYVTINPDFKSMYKSLVSNPSLIKSLGWEPEITFKELAKLMVR